MNGVTITIPEAQTMTVSDGEKVGLAEISFVEFAKQVWLMDPRLGQSIELLSAKESIASKLESANGSLELWQNEQQLLLQIAKAPSRPYNPADSKGVLVFYEALANAALVDDKEGNGSQSQ